MSYLIHAPVALEVDDAGFDGVETVFVDLLPCEPYLGDGGTVILHHSGIGTLRRVASAPGAGEFALSGATNRTVTFGTAPVSGDYIHASFVSA